MKAHRHPAKPRRGSGDGGRQKAALARLHSGGSLNRSHAYAAEGGGSSLAPLGRRSFAVRARASSEQFILSAIALSIAVFEERKLR